MRTLRMFTTVTTAALVAGATAVVAVQAFGRSASVPRPTTRQAPAAPTPQAIATNAHCGQVVTASLTLNGDLYCNSSGTFGLRIGKASVVLNLNGHAVYGPGPSLAGSMIGIEISGTTDTVENGAVTGFAVGIRVDGGELTVGQATAARVSKVAVSSNNTGVVDTGTRTTLIGVSVFDNFVRGATCSGCVTPTYTTSSFLNNGYGDTVIDADGLSIYGATGMTVSGNKADGNLGFGILVNNSTGTLKDNVANYNLLLGISASGPFNVDGGGNTATSNQYRAATHQPQCDAVACG